MIDILLKIQEVLAIIIPMMIGILVLISKLTKNLKLRKIAENLVKVEKVVFDYVNNAEGFVNYSGNDKKEWVKTKVNQFCITNKITYKDEIIDEIIENYITLSKTVNKRESEKEVLL